MRRRLRSNADPGRCPRIRAHSRSSQVWDLKSDDVTRRDSYMETKLHNCQLLAHCQLEALHASHTRCISEVDGALLQNTISSSSSMTWTSRNHNSVNDFAASGMTRATRGDTYDQDEHCTLHISKTQRTKIDTSARRNRCPLSPNSRIPNRETGTFLPLLHFREEWLLPTQI